MRKKLSELKPREKGIIVNITEKGDVTRRLLAMGLVIGTEVKALRRAPLNDPIEFEVRGYNISIRKEEAERVLVEVKNDA